MASDILKKQIRQLRREKMELLIALGGLTFCISIGGWHRPCSSHIKQAEDVLKKHRRKAGKS